MGIPQVQINVQDNGLGQVPFGLQNLLVVIGTSSKGTPNFPVESAQPAVDIVPQFGYGPGPQLAAFINAQSGNPVLFVKADTATPGSSTAVRATVPGGSTSVVTLSGTPNDDMYGLVTVIVGGTIGSAGIQIGVSFDNGRTTAQTYNLGAATTQVVENTGLTLNFGGGSLVAGDTFAWVSTAPAWSDSTVASAIQALYSLPFGEDFLDIIIAGPATGSDATAFDGYMTSLFNKRRYARLLCQARDVVWGGTSTETESQWVSSIETDFQNVSSLRVGVCAGYYNFISPIDQSQYRRPNLWGAAGRDSQVAIQVDLARVSDGSLANLVVVNKPDGFVYHDEQLTPGLDAARFLSCRTITGLPGFFITNPNIMCPPGSDFNWLQHGHVIDAASKIVYVFMTQYLSSAIRVDAKTGYPLLQDIQEIQFRLKAQLDSQLTNAGAVSSISVAIPQAQNVLSTSVLLVNVGVVPLFYLKQINVTLQFQNPAIQQVQVANPGP